jgi:Binding-prot-dependent transport system membrane comp, N-term
VTVSFSTLKRDVTYGSAGTDGPPTRSSMTLGWLTAATGPEFERLTMANYVLRRTAHAVLVLWCTFTAAFFLLYALPGDAALSKLNVSAGGQGLSLEAVKALRESLGLDQPILVLEPFSYENV